MLIPISWLKDYVDITLPLPQLAQALTLAGLEVDEIHSIGLPIPADRNGFKFTGLPWAPDKIVVASISEVMPHPNADRLVLCKLNDGLAEHVVLTGAPNLFEYKGKGELSTPLKVAYAREGAVIYDGHQPGQVLTTLKRAKIRGVDSYSMVCSEKELGISDEHEGILFLDADAPAGAPLADVLGDAVLDISILPNMIRNACVLGVAREVAAITGQKLRTPSLDYLAAGASIKGQVEIKITNPEMNPRFVAGLIKNITVAPSPLIVQHRLRLAGMRPISNIVDATNYVMLLCGEPLHAFDYDVLVRRASGKAPTVITRQANPGEKLTTLDGVDRNLDGFTELVCDTSGALSIAGAMGGMESEVTDQTRNILLEGASWNFINIRKTVASQKLQSEAAYRFSRGIHPALAKSSVRLGLRLMKEWGAGEIARDLVDEYPLPMHDPVITLNTADIDRNLGIKLSAKEIAGILERLEFKCTVRGEEITAVTPPHRVDIGEGLTGKADLLEEIARIYGYDKIPEIRLKETLPVQRGNPVQESEDAVRDLMVSLGFQEVISYRLTSPDREARIDPELKLTPVEEYIRLQNPSTPERRVMRRSLLASVLDAVEKNIHLVNRLAFFEVGPVFIPVEGQALPDEPRRLALAVTGMRDYPDWERQNPPQVDFYDLKGAVEAFLTGFGVSAVTFKPASVASFHPGKCAEVYSGETELGVFGELHPKVSGHFDFGGQAVYAADFDLQAIITCRQKQFNLKPVFGFPPVLEDIAVIVDETIPAADVEQLIRQTGGKVLTDVRLFDIFRGVQIGLGKKSLAYNLTYQAADRTLTDKETTAIRQKIVRRLEHEFSAKLRSS
jgi:phenylalanyl-tRNA synthetase beta chain